MLRFMWSYPSFWPAGPHPAALSQLQAPQRSQQMLQQVTDKDTNRDASRLFQISASKALENLCVQILHFTVLAGSL